MDNATERAAALGPMEKIIDGVVEKVMSNAGTRTVYGDPVQEANRTVIPVARVTYRFGFGGGTGPPENTGDPPPGGGGGGGNLTARPVGFIEISNEGSRFVPVIDWSRILTTILTVVPIATLLMVWTMRPRGNND